MARGDPPASTLLGSYLLALAGPLVMGGDAAWVAFLVPPALYFSLTLTHTHAIMGKVALPGLEPGICRLAGGCSIH